MIALLYAPACVFFAWLNAKWIAEGKRIKHFWNGLLHVTVAGLIAWLTEWYHFITVLAVARLFFDVALSLFRGLPFDYISPDPNSIWDQVEKKVFKEDGITPKLIYLLIIVCSLIVK